MRGRAGGGAVLWLGLRQSWPGAQEGWVFCERLWDECYQLSQGPLGRHRGPVSQPGFPNALSYHSKGLEGRRGS